MNERASDVQARLGAVRQLSAVISAMRGIAAAHTRDAHGHLGGVRAYASTIAHAIGRAMSLADEAQDSSARFEISRGEAIVALFAEQGFVGRFNDRILDAVRTHTGRAHQSSILLVGDRGVSLAIESGLRPAWSLPMIVRTGDAEAFAAQIADEIARRLDAGLMTSVRLIHAAPQGPAGVQVIDRLLVPFDLQRFERISTPVSPLVSLPPRVLTARLAEEYVFAELCEALILSYAAENETRMRSMVAARANIEKQSAELTDRFRRLRQEEITSEIVELASGRAAQVARASRRRS